MGADSAKERADKLAAYIGLLGPIGTGYSVMYGANGVGTPAGQISDFGQFYEPMNHPKESDASKRTADNIMNAASLASMGAKYASPAVKAGLTAAGMIANEYSLLGLGDPVAQISDTGDVYDGKGNRYRLNHENSANVLLGDF